MLTILISFAEFVMFNQDAAEGGSFVKNACEKGAL